MLELTKVNSEYAKSVEEWFVESCVENKYIEFYRSCSKWIELINNNLNRHGYVFIDGDIVVGFVDIEIIDNDAWIGFGVAPKLRNKGFGSKLLSEIDGLTEIKHARSIRAGVEVDNYACQKLLEKNKFKKTEVKEKGIINYLRTKV